MTNKKDDHFLSLIVPVYKKEKIIVENIKSLKSALDSIRYQYEIIAVVDGKVDNSFGALKKAKIQNTCIIYYKQNHGKAFAIRTGMHHAKGDYVMFIDSGREIDPNGISMLLEHMEWYKADIIVGSKRHPASLITYSPLRKILSFGYYMFVRTFFGLKIKDTQAGIKIFRKKVLEKILPRLLEKKFCGDLEMLVVSSHLGFKRIFEAPIKLDYTLEPLTSAATWRTIVGMVLDTLAIYYRLYIVRYYNQSHNKYAPPDDMIIVSSNKK